MTAEAKSCVHAHKNAVHTVKKTKTGKTYTRVTVKCRECPKTWPTWNATNTNDCCGARNDAIVPHTFTCTRFIEVDGWIAWAGCTPKEPCNAPTRCTSPVHHAIASCFSDDPCGYCHHVERVRGAEVVANG